MLPVGGVKEKVIAAHRAGLKRVILPQRNQKDLDEIDESVRKELQFIFVDDIHQVLDVSIGNHVTNTGSRSTARRSAKPAKRSK